MELLFILLVILAVTRVFGEIALRLGQPALVGELVSGILLGVAANHFSGHLWVMESLTENDAFIALTDLGVFFLMLLAGLEMHPRDVIKSSGGALLVAAGGMIVPIATGCLLAWFYIPPSEVRLAQVFFVGTALAITSVPVAVKVLIDLGQLHSKAGQIIVSAAIIDDVLSLVLLAMLTALIGTGEWPDAEGLLMMGGKVVAFFGITVGAGLVVLPWIGKQLGKLWIEEFEFSALLVVGLAFGILAEVLGLHFILGGFIAGLFFTRRIVSKRIHRDVKKKVGAITTGFLAPLFFASIGFHVDFQALAEVPVFVVLLIVVAAASKLLGSGITARMSGLSNHESMVVGVGMSGRGAVELIIADIAHRAGLFAYPDPPPPIISNLFSAIVLMAIVTTIAAPVGLRTLMRGQAGENDFSSKNDQQV